jgi:hypothetical protein
MFPLLQPRQKAIYFPEDCASGATIGYYCTILGLVTASSESNPSRPDLWIYRVALANSTGYLEVPAGCLFGSNEFDSAETKDDTEKKTPACEIRFANELCHDNEEIRGIVRLEGREWEPFVFEKWELPYRSYELARPVQGGMTKAGTLIYRVPSSQFLDRYCVLSALIEVFRGASQSPQRT